MRPPTPRQGTRPSILAKVGNRTSVLHTVDRRRIMVLNCLADGFGPFPDDRRCLMPSGDCAPLRLYLRFIKTELIEPHRRLSDDFEDLLCRVCRNNCSLLVRWPGCVGRPNGSSAVRELWCCAGRNMAKRAARAICWDAARCV